jgi:hypothetical protein
MGHSRARKISIDYKQVTFPDLLLNKTPDEEHKIN